MTRLKTHFFSARWLVYSGVGAKCLQFRLEVSNLSYLDLARQAIKEVNPELTEKFLAIVEFSYTEPDLAYRRRKSTKSNSEPSTTDLEHYLFLANKFNRGRIREGLPQPSTIPDPVLPLIMHYGYGEPEKDLCRLVEGHRTAMVAENMIGELLERYLDSVLEDSWIWCAGGVVKHVDFIQRPSTPNDPWKALQIKNRDNTENSSSKLVRNGTEISKWYRTKSRSGETMWEKFPLENKKLTLSEKGFQAFAKNLILEYKK